MIDTPTCSMCGRPLSVNSDQMLACPEHGIARPGQVVWPEERRAAAASAGTASPTPAAGPPGAWEEFASTFREWHYFVGGGALTIIALAIAILIVALRWLDVLEARAEAGGR